MAIETAVSVDLMLGGWLLVLSLGYQTSPGDASVLIQRPFLFARALFPIFVVVPAIAFLVIRAVPVEPAIQFAIVTLAVSPVLPTLHLKQMRFGSQADYPIGLLIAASLGALVTTPLLVDFASNLLNVSAGISTCEVAELVALSAGFPLVLGMVVRIVVGPGSSLIGRYARPAGNVLIMGGLLMALVFT